MLALVTLGLMMRRVGKYIAIAVLVFSCALIMYGAYGPYYNTVPLESSFSFGAESPQKFEFLAEKTDTYMVEIHLRNLLPEEGMKDILGNHEKEGKIDIEWSVQDGGEIIAHDSNKSYGYSPIWGGGFSGLSIGEVTVQRGKSYTLLLYVNNSNSSWNVTKPSIEVGLHPARLEYLISYIIYGVLLLIICAPFLSYFLYKKIIG